MQRYIENCSSCVRLPSHMHEKCRQLKKLEREFAKYYGRSPTDCEISLNLGISIAQVEKIRNGLKWGNMVSIDAFVSDEDGGTIGEMIAADTDIENEVLDRVEEEERRAALWSLVDELPEDQAQVIRMQYRDNRSMKEISEEIKSDYSAVRITRDKAMRSLRRSRSINRFMPENVRAVAFRPVGAQAFQRTWTSSTEKAALREMAGY